ncbi:GspH/FimT family pseudopilin [Psychromonas ossibalaenae]|uniref:GspH/FimT family pseudopilin n=1 Tax=Psychromonas ossibalaenae TaxID=444922 RepID=UPI000365607B|nr:GspH/FimT family pseudopilin [Psychromonas ossibalaenae]
MKYNSVKNSQGLTLLELLVAMAVVIILAGVGVPSFNSFMAKERLTVATNELYNAYRFARNEALKVSSSMILDAADGSDWALGWQVENNDGDVLYKSKVPHSSITISASAVTVKGMGSVTSAVNYSITGAEGTNCINILISGQSKLKSGSC